MASIMARGSATESDKRRAAMAFKTVPVLPNCYPYNEMLFSGQLQTLHHSHHGDGVKTRSWAPKHRGPILLYTSTSVHRTPCLAWGYDPKNFESGVIVGVGNLVDVRKLDDGELFEMFVAFNNLGRFRKGEKDYRPMTRDYEFRYDLKAADKWARANQCGPIRPFPNGLFFANLRRFKKPIPFKPPNGAVSMFRASLSLVKKSLKEVGY